MTTSSPRCVALSALLLVVACAKPASDGGPTGSTGNAPPGADACPKDLLAAVGKSCASDGQTCGTSPTGFTHFIMCSGGKWAEMNAPPPPPPPPKAQ